MNSLEAATNYALIFFYVLHIDFQKIKNTARHFFPLTPSWALGLVFWGYDLIISSIAAEKKPNFSFAICHAFAFTHIFVIASSKVQEHYTKQPTFLTFQWIEVMNVTSWSIRAKSKIDITLVSLEKWLNSYTTILLSALHFICLNTFIALIH